MLMKGFKIESLRFNNAKNTTIYICLLFLVLCFCGCETPVSVKLPGKENKKVIEGWIENDQPAVVIVSNLLPYFSTIDMETILASVDTNATVRITDDMGNTEQLGRGFSFDHFFGVLGYAYVGKNIKGIPGHTYTLYVESEGKTYTSQTTIPQNPVLVDSLSMQLLFSNDTTASLRIYFHDDPTTYDCYRFFLMIKDLDLIYSPIHNGTFDDLLFGGSAGSYEMLRRAMSNLPISGRTQEERDNYYRAMFRKGDIIYVKSTQVDKKTYLFWFPLQTALSTGSNPFFPPVTYPTNIEGENVAGVWSGYHARYDTIEFHNKDSIVMKYAKGN